MKRLLTIATFCTALLLTLGLNQQAAAQQKIKHPDIRVGVDGLACPFCAYGIEKKLKKIDQIDKISVNIKEGTVDLKLKEEATLSENSIKKAVKNAGFDTRSIIYLNKSAKTNTQMQGK